MRATNATEEDFIRTHRGWIKARAAKFVRDHPSLDRSHVDDLFQIGCEMLLLFSRAFPEITHPQDDQRLSRRIQIQMYDYLCLMTQAVALPRNMFTRKHKGFKSVPLSKAETVSADGFEPYALDRIIIREFFNARTRSEQNALQMLMEDHHRYELMQYLHVSNPMGVSRKLRKYREELGHQLEIDDRNREV